MGFFRCVAALGVVLAIAGAPKVATSEAFKSAPAPKAALPHSIADATKRILVLHSYHPSFHSTAVAMDELRKAFGHGYDLEEVFLDTKRQRPILAFGRAEPVIRASSALRRPPDLVITFDDNALIFADRRAAELFPNAPIIFAGVNSLSLSQRMAAKPNVTGVHEGLSMAATVDLAKALNPTALKRIVGIVDSSVSSQVLLSELRDVLTNRPDLSLELLSLENLTFSQAAERMAQDARRDMVYFFLAAFADRSGAAFSTVGVFDRIGPASARPIYTLVDDGGPWPSSVVGGRLLSAKAQVDVAVEMAKRVLAGEPVAQIPPRMKSPNVTQVDARAIARFGLRAEALGADARVVNAEPGFWSRNGEAIVAALGVLAAMLAVLCVVSFVNIRVRKGLQRLNRALGQRNAELLAAKARIEHQSMHDALTQLPNRRFVENRFRKLRYEALDDGLWALLHVDLDRFKQINDTFGHAAGDHVLVTVAKTLSGHVPDRGFAARIGGDEFLVFGRFEDRRAVEAHAQALVDALSRPVPYENHLCRFGASVGVSIAGADADADADLFRHADIALYKAKDDGRGRFAFFSFQDQERLAARKALADDLARGIEAGEIEPFFQPQICARTGRVSGAEALARWRHPERGVLAPGAFMAAAESMSLVADIDRAILHQTRRRLDEWREAGVVLPRVSVNLSSRRLLDPGLARQVETLDFGDTALCFELVESIFLERADAETMWAVDRLREIGGRIEIDDFGTGHASILSLLRLKPDTLKIARELVAPIEEGAERLQLVRSIVEIGRSLDISVTAEGVETPGQRRLLSRLGCDHLQGFGIARPMPAEQIPDFVVAHHAEIDRAIA